MAITIGNLQPLLDQFKGTGLVVSCYADLSATPGIPMKWPGLFTAKAAPVKKMLSDEPQAWQQFEENFQAIGRALEAPEALHVRSMAVFSARQRGFFQCFTFDMPVENELVVHEAPYLVPLLQVFCRQREYLVVLSDTHRGRLYAATTNAVRLLHEIEEEVPARQHSAGERWGMQQATIARHREDRIHHFQKELVELIDKTWIQHPFRGLVLLGEHEVLEHTRKRLSSHLVAQVVHEGPLSWTEEPLELTGDVCSVLAEVECREEERFEKEVAERLSQSSRIASSPRQVVDALQSGRVGPHGHGYVMLGPDPHESVARCSACRALFVDMPVTCPRCQAPCVEANLWEEILLFALRHNIVARCEKSNASLLHCGGVLAVLPEKEVSR